MIATKPIRLVPIQYVEDQVARNLNQGDYVCGGEYGTDEQAEAIHEAISYTLWDRGCGDNFDLPRTETV